MEFGFTEEQNMLRDSARRFMKRECTRDYVRECSDNDRFPLELYEKMVKQGWMGIPFPEKYGGAGMGPLELATFLEEAAYAWYGAGAAYFVCAIVGGHNILTCGSESQKDHFLPRIINGEYKFAFALTEPNVGSDSAAVELFANEEGDHYILNGTKMFITNAHVADFIITVARTKRDVKKKHQGLTIFLVDTKSPGIQIRPLKQLGRSANHANEIVYQNVKVPKENILGNVNEGWSNLNKVLGYERAAVAVMYTGTAQAIIDYTMSYAKERMQFGQAISKFQVIQHKFADMQTKVDASRLLAYRVSWMLKKELPCFKEMSMAKLYASQTLFFVANEGVQIMGGYGVMKEFDMEMYFRDSRIIMITGGTSEIQKTLIAKQMGL